MRNEEEIEKNKIIASFMGLVEWPQTKLYHFPRWCEPDPNDRKKTGKFVGYDFQLDYHKNWSSLMPVVEKIREHDGAWTLRPGLASVVNYGSHIGDHKFKFIKSTVDFEEVNGESVPWTFIVFSVCVEFIKWYNEQQGK